jgi:MYXO-CTERM domain-containing protein
MRTLVSTAAVLAVCSSAHAESFMIDYTGRAQLDPTATFEADCLGATEAPDCGARASLLEAELVEALAELEGLSDDATQALFSNAVGSDSAAVKEVGLRYFSRRRALPSTLWTSVKEFFLGPDPQIGQPSAEILGFSENTTDQELSDLYLKLRPSSIYAQDYPSNSGEQDEWAEACASDTRLDEVPAFAEHEQFAPASRLLAIDRYLQDVQTGEATLPASGFVTDAPKADVIAFFDKLFGKAAAPAGSSSEARLQALQAELAALEPKLARGDQTAIKRATEIIDELSELSADVAAASVLQLEDCADCVYWMSGFAADNYTQGFTRAVVVGTQPQLQRTMISYLGKGGSVTQVPVDGGTQGSDAGVTTRPDAGDEAAANRKSDGCSTHGGAAGAWWLLALGLLLLRRRHGQFM